MKALAINAAEISIIGFIALEFIRKFEISNDLKSHFEQGHSLMSTWNLGL